MDDEISKSIKRRTSKIWGMFHMIDKVSAECIICHQPLAYRSSVTNLKKHLLSKHGSVQINYGDEVTDIAGFFRSQSQPKPENSNSFPLILHVGNENPPSKFQAVESLVIREVETPSTSLLEVPSTSYASTSETTPTLSSASISKNVSKRKDKLSETMEHVMPHTRKSPRIEDEYDAIGVNIAAKLRAMNTTQRIIGEKIIALTLFHGQMKTLTSGACLEIPKENENNETGDVIES